MSYNAMIAKLENVRKAENSDFLQIAGCMGYSIVVDLKAKNDDIIVLFVDDGQLSHEYVYNNNLYNKPEMNLNPNAKCGFFESNRKIRVQSFRGNKSEAYAASLDSLKFTGYDISSLSVGDQFSELNGVPICNKYMTTKTIAAAKANAPKTEAGFNKKSLKKLFPEHMDTSQVRHARDDEFVGLVTITNKIHGTSHRSIYNQFPVEKPLNVFQNLWNIFVEEILEGEKHLFNFFLNQIQKNKLRFHPKTKMEWKKIYGTRRVIKGEVQPEDDDYRTNTHRLIAPYMNKGEVWYAEIVGFEQGCGGKSIMMPVSTDQLKPYINKADFKEFKNQFGDQMVYKYGCLPNTFDVYVYRIAIINEDGVLHDLPWGTVKERCKTAGLKPVPEVGQHLIVSVDQVPELRERIEYLTNGSTTEPIDRSHICEGKVIRIDSQVYGTVKLLKNKNFFFKIMEGITKDADVIDEEESQGEYEEELVA